MSTDPMFDVHSAIRKKKKHRRGGKGAKGAKRDQGDASASSSASSTSSSGAKGLVATLLEGLDAPSVTSYIDTLRAEFLNEAAPGDEAARKEGVARRRMWTVESMYAVAKNPSMPVSNAVDGKWCNFFFYFFLTLVTQLLYYIATNLLYHIVACLNNIHMQ